MSSSLDRKIEAAARRAAEERKARGMPAERFHKDDHQVDGTVKPSAHVAPAPAPAPAAPPKKTWYRIDADWINDQEPTLIYRTRDGLVPRADGSNVIETLDKVLGTHVPDTVPGSVAPSLPPQAPDPTLAPKRQVLNAAAMAECEQAALTAMTGADKDEAEIAAMPDGPDWQQLHENEWVDLNAPDCNSHDRRRYRTLDGKAPREDMGNVSVMIRETVATAATCSMSVGYREQNRPVKPPIGLTPRWLVNEQRLADVKRAIHRYMIHGHLVPPEWLAERDELELEVERRENQRDSRTFRYMQSPRGHGKSWLTMGMYYEMQRRLHANPWPTYIDFDGPEEMPSGNFGQRPPGTRRVIIQDDKLMAEKARQWCVLVNQGMEEARRAGKLPLTFYITEHTTRKEWENRAARVAARMIDPESPKAPDTAAPKD